MNSGKELIDGAEVINSVKARRTAFAKRIALGVVAIAAGFITLACQPSKKTADCATDGSYDSEYAMTFYSEGKQMALGTFAVKHGRFEGDLINAEGRKFSSAGCVRKGGELAFDKIEGEKGITVVAAGKVDKDGAVEGRYSFPDRKGMFFGSRKNAPIQSHAISSNGQFDGNYKVDYFRGGKRMATVRNVVKDGKFSFAEKNVKGEKFSVEGYVLSDGTLIFNALDGDLSITAEGSIDHLNHNVQGTYRIGGEAGVFSGTRQDPSVSSQE